MYSSSFITLPSETIINFYYYYSNFTFILSWLITPLLFYVILTQSKNLKSFKWLILNHSIWCLSFQTFMALTKIFILSPTFSGYPLGLFRNGNAQTTLIVLLIAIILVVHCISSILATLFCRYMLVFPFGISLFFSKKLFILNIIAVVTIIYSFVGIFLTKILTATNDFNHWEDFSDSSLITNLSINEPAFILIPFSFIKTIFFIIIIIDFLIIIIAIFFSIFFFYLLTTSKLSQKNSSLKRSLLLSGAVEILILFVFMLFPCIFLMICIRFQIPNTAEAACLGFCVVLTHFIVESITTLIFVSPYRKWLTKLWSKVFPCFDYKIKKVNVIINR